MTLDLDSLKRAAEEWLKFSRMVDAGLSGQIAYSDYAQVTHPSTVLELIARLEASERDGARYRWLRDKSEPHKCALYMSVGEAFKDVKFTRLTVDTAIDDAIAGEFPEGTNAMAPS